MPTPQQREVKKEGKLLYYTGMCKDRSTLKQIYFVITPVPEDLLTIVMINKHRMMATGSSWCFLGLSGLSRHVVCCECVSLCTAVDYLGREEPLVKLIGR